MDTLRWYPSKVDTWLAVALAIGPMVPLAMVVLGLLGGQWDMVGIGLCSTAFMLAIYGGLVFPMRYAIDATHLIVRSGVVRRRVPLAAIRAVRPTSNPLSSPALSLDRLRIEHGDGPFGAVMISPADRDSFLSELASRAGLERRGETLVRAGS